MKEFTGPEIPPHILANRKRKAEEEAAAATVRSQTEKQEAKKTRTLGPAPPPAPLDERPVGSPEEDDSSSDDGIGPSLPPGPGREADEEAAAQRRLAKFEEAKATIDDGKPKRDEWMLIPPKSEDWASKVDPTKLRNRKFQTGKGSKAPNKPGTDNTLWTESPAEKRKRLEDEVMGVRKPATLDDGRKPDKNAAETAETARRIREYNDKNRSKSLYDEHKKSTTREKEDDPSARAFDREKDIAGGRKIGHQQKREMLDRAAQFGSRFSSGSYL